MVVGTHIECNSIFPVQHELAGDWLITRYSLLINARSLKAQLATVQLDDQISIGGDLNLLRAVKVEFDAPEISPWVNPEVVFQASLVSVKIEIDSRINSAVADSRKLGNVALPSRWDIPDEV